MPSVQLVHEDVQRLSLKGDVSPLADEDGRGEECVGWEASDVSLDPSRCVGPSEASTHDSEQPVPAGARPKRRHDVWEVVVQPENADLGLELDPQFADPHLFVMSIRPGSAVGRLNAARPEVAVRPGDLLISVNGTMVAEDMLDALAERGHDSWSLCFMREY
jgi:hypothetical protein